jgi:hypothetical protein
MSDSSNYNGFMTTNTLNKLSIANFTQFFPGTIPLSLEKKWAHSKT